MVYIKRIELYGFKSFGNRKINISFSPRFNVIVGPNGAGKSNVIDALSFVFGDISAKRMRAKSLSDLVFAGTKREKPADMARVTLILDNSDGQLPLKDREISITRVVRRKGGTVYRINGRRATRTELLGLLDSLRFSPGGYNFIFQGEVTRFATMSPLEIRQLLEDISEISVFEEERLKAEQELKEVTEKFERIRLIIAEVQREFERTKMEREIALHYIALGEEIKRKEALLVYTKYVLKSEELENLVHVKSDIEEKMKKLKEKEEELLTEIKNLEEEFETKRGTVEKYISERLGDVKEKLSNLRAELRGRKATLKMFKTRLSEVLNEREALSKRLRDYSEKIITLNNEIRCLEEEKRKTEELLERELDELRNLREEASKAGLDAIFKLKSIKEELSKLQSALSSLKTEERFLMEEISSLERELNPLKEMQKEFKADLEVTRVNENRLGLELKKMKKDNTEIQRKIEEKRKLIEKIDEEVKNLFLEYNELKGRLKRVEGQLEVLRESAQYIATRKILELRDSGVISGIIGTVGELLKVDEKFLLAIGAALGNQINYIVVEDDRVAAECIRFLKERKLGRASFLPLNFLKPQRIFIEEFDEKGIIDVAVDLVQFPPHCKPAFEFLLGRTIIVEDFDVAREVARRRRVKIVTLEGDVIEPSGVIRGGFSKKEKASVFSLEAKAKKLEEELAELEARRKEKETLRSQLFEELEILRKERSKVFDALNEKHQELERLHMKIEDITKKIEEQKRKIKEKTDLLCQKQKDMSEVRLQIKETEAEINKLRKIEADLTMFLEGIKAREFQEKIREKEKKVESVRKKLEDVNYALASKKASLSQLMERKRELEEEMHRLEERTKNLERKINELNKEIATLKDEVDRLSALEKTVLDEIKDLKIEVENLRETLKEKRQSYERLKENIEKLRGKITQLIIELEKIREEKRILERELEDKKKDLPEPVEIVDPYILEKEVEELRDKRRQLEPVNMRAIEQFKEVKKRYDNLKEKFDEVKREKDALEEHLHKIEVEKKRVFMSTFDKVSRYFRDIFSNLSGGGEANLVLENPEDPFQGGIKIFARPPGKKLKSIEVMSGGEKTLTALSLIFAIQHVKPSFFYILDEIDAALDDSNAKKVAKLIREMSNRSQFIVVTLRDVTMSEADKLIGVTNRNGISKVIELTLEEAKRYGQK